MDISRPKVSGVPQAFCVHDRQIMSVTAKETLVPKTVKGPVHVNRCQANSIRNLLLREGPDENVSIREFRTLLTATYLANEVADPLPRIATTEADHPLPRD